MSAKNLCALVFLLAIPTLQAQKSLYPPADLLAKIKPDAIRAQMAYLSDDLLEGRRTGTRGYMLAAKYVAAQLQEMGLKPGGDNRTYFQKVRFREITLTRDKTTFTLKMNGQEHSLSFGDDFIAGGDDLSPDSSLEGQLVFVGYGVTAPEFNYDDYANTDVRGKIVVALYGAPMNFPIAPHAHYSSSTVKIANAVARGAIGYISIWGGKRAQRTPLAKRARYVHSRLRWLDENNLPNDAQPQIKGSAAISEAVATKMFEGAAKSYKEAFADSEANKPQSFPLKATVALHLVSTHTETDSPNVVAILPGSDPKLKDEYVVFSAHLDHLGIGAPVNGDNIYNGAIDNGSGSAGVLEVARALSTMQKAPRRSIVFLFVTGEEEGLLGSDAYAYHPTVPIEKIAANVNMDELSCWYDFADIVPQGADHSTIGKVVDDVARHMNLQISPDPQPDEVFFVRSDQYSFVKRGVPAVAVDAGYKTVDPKLDGKKIQDDWEDNYYHQPNDDMNQPYLDLNAAAKCVRMDLAIG
ncbi:MAG TPA: M28 family metallopeptidase, partial [Terriglobales bacterium]|nr:M28 family metallopeptidase [Terriglobales bacterium]